MDPKDVTQSPNGAPTEDATGKGSLSRREAVELLDELKTRMDGERYEENLAFEIIQVGNQKELSRRLAAQFNRLNSWLHTLASIVREQQIALGALGNGGNGKASGPTLDPRAVRAMLLKLGAQPRFRAGLCLDIHVPPAVSADGLADCSRRVDQCLARCCKRPVPLTLEEAASEKYDWNEDDPFRLRRLEDGYCRYMNRDGSFSCSIYESRPFACRTCFCDDALNPDKATATRDLADFSQAEAGSLDCHPRDVDDLITGPERPQVEARLGSVTSIPRTALHVPPARGCKSCGTDVTDSRDSAPGTVPPPVLGKDGLS